MKNKIGNGKNGTHEILEIYPEDWEEFERGVGYFNNQQFQHSYEAWELLWERKSLTARKFLRGLMELSIACQHVSRSTNLHNFEKNLETAHQKLEPFIPEYFGVSIKPLLEHINVYKETITKLKNNGHFAKIQQYPQIQFHKPEDPDIAIELCEIVQSDQFIEGAKLFNRGFYWEAHEAWEEMRLEQNGNGKVFLETLTHIAESFSFIKMAKITTAIYLLEKSINKLRQFERIRCGISLPALVEVSQKTLDCLRIYTPDCRSPLKLPTAPSIIFVE